MHRNIVIENLPPERVVVHFKLRGSSHGKSRFWLVLRGDEADICLTDPGFGVDLVVEAHVRTMVRVWMGDVTFDEAIRSGDLLLDGPRALRLTFPMWFGRSLFATVERP